MLYNDRQGCLRTVIHIYEFSCKKSYPNCSKKALTKQKRELIETKSIVNSLCVEIFQKKERNSDEVAMGVFKVFVSMCVCVFISRTENCVYVMCHI